MTTTINTGSVSNEVVLGEGNYRNTLTIAGNVIVNEAGALADGQSIVGFALGDSMYSPGLSKPAKPTSPAPASNSSKAATRTRWCGRAITPSRLFS
jgi:hypothetical protein